MQSKVPEIVISGGPCSGKTTGMAYISEKLKDWGFRVFIVPEVATPAISSGLKDINEIAKTNPSKYLEIQRGILLKQRNDRMAYNFWASLFPGEKRVILFDRGEMDGAAYVPSFEHFLKMMKREGLTLHDVRDSYEGVIHLVTAADGAEEFYTTKNNKARQEKTPAEARKMDRKTMNVWMGHPHLKIIDNSTDFIQKMQRALSAIARILGIPVPIEIERKFLLAKRPNLNIGAFKNAVVVNIEQIYLLSAVEEELRIRKRSQDASSTYYETRKIHISESKRWESESFITPSEYLFKKSLQKPGTDIIQKQRVCFVYNNQYFELDIFSAPKKLNGLCLLEIELTEENEEVRLPKFLKIEREVTNEPEFSNSCLAQIH